MMLCSACGVRVPAAFDYGPAGEIECVPCARHRDIVANERRSTGTVTACANGALGAGVLSLVFNPFLFVSMVAIATAIYPLQSVGGGVEHAAVRRHLTPGAVLYIQIASVLGLVAGAIAILVPLVMMVLSIAALT